jgi:hypothetical protein
MAIQWTNIRIPVHLHARLVRMADEIHRRSCDWLPGQFESKLPAEFLDRGVPLWWVIERSLTEFEDHRRRSRWKRRRRP